MIAAEQFLGIGKDGIREVAVNVLEGRMREVIGTMTVEEIYRGRAEFNEKVVAAAKADFAKMGLVLLAFALKEFSDTQGYITLSEQAADHRGQARRAVWPRPRARRKPSSSRPRPARRPKWPGCRPRPRSPRPSGRTRPRSPIR